MQVLLTGATGDEVSGLARSDASAARLTAIGVRPVPGDMADPTTLAALPRHGAYTGRSG